MDPMDLRCGIDKAVVALVGELKQRRRKITTQAETAQVATISANGEADIDRMIAEAMQKVGNDGVITVEEAKGIKTELNTTSGPGLQNALARISAEVMAEATDWRPYTPVAMIWRATRIHPGQSGE
jgi:chaperonin GroEL (HSP60 family)